MRRQMQLMAFRSLTSQNAAARRLRRICVLWMAGLIVAGASGCGSMHRRMTVRSDPPGALVLVDGEEVGFTPVSVDFTYYGTREISLIKDGYETLTVLQDVPAPWYQYVPVDFVSDNLLPVKLTNRHDFSYRLRKAETVPTQELLDRANSLRSETRLER